LRNAWDKETINYIKKKLIEKNINTVVITDDKYPKRMKHYEDSPYMLFYKGNIEKINNEYSIAIVGSRNCTSYGVNITNIICDHLCRNNINLISGMAKGIDTVAHSAFISNNAYNCAILGSGLDIIYPKENSSTYNSIIENGCVISQFLPGTEPLSFHFPIRNRIIASLCDVLIVVEAGIKSGSLITSSAALDKGKDVIAVPGNIFSAQSKGTNKLIKDGAHTFTDIEDVFQLLNFKNVNKPKFSVEEMKPDEKVVYMNINTNPIHFDDVLRLTKIDIKQLYEVLFELQLKNEILSISGNYYVRNNKQI
jgi:DNA processing protein